jgi:hypothetical protein
MGVVMDEGRRKGKARKARGRGSKRRRCGFLLVV